MIEDDALGRGSSSSTCTAMEGAGGGGLNPLNQRAVFRSRFAFGVWLASG
jgi:hypothetical protein